MYTVSLGKETEADCSLMRHSLNLFFVDVERFSANSTGDSQSLCSGQKGLLGLGEAVQPVSTALSL